MGREYKGVHYQAEILKRQGSAPANSDHDLTAAGVVYRASGSVPAGVPIWIGRHGDIDLGEVTYGDAEACPRHCIELRFFSEVELRLGSVKTGRVGVQALDIDPDYAGPLPAWRGEVDEYQAPMEPAFTKHKQMIVRSRSLWLDLPFVGCRVVLHWEPTTEAVTTPEVARERSRKPTPTVIRSSRIRKLNLAGTWPQTATLHFMIAMDAMHEADIEHSLDDQSRAHILNRLTETGRMETRASDHPWDAQRVGRKQALVEKHWKDHGCTSLGEYAAVLAIPAGTLDGLYANTMEVAVQYLVNPWT